jgi:hypothetical protein
MRTLIAKSGFHELVWEDTTSISLEWFRERSAASKVAGAPSVGLHLLLGNTFAEAFANNLRNLEESRAVIIEGVFERF